jgi:hypothetical protein
MENILFRGNMLSPMAIGSQESAAKRDNIRIHYVKPG